VKKQLIAALVVWAGLAFAGHAQASPGDSSPPAPLRAAASPRHSAAGASATATHAGRSHHARRHHRRHHAASKAQLSARVPWTAAGASPPQPVRRPVAPRHPALRPASHDRSHARNRSVGGHAAAVSSRVSLSAGAGGLEAGLLEEPASRALGLNQGRGPPRAPPCRIVSLSRRRASPHRRPILGSSEPPDPASDPTRISDPFQSRDTRPRRPRVRRAEGAAACPGRPSNKKEIPS